MSNSYFQFKQFTILQDRCAMKVTTDACILGAAVNVAVHEHRVLDIGAGSGLLSLMVAQRFPKVIIDAVELDAAAADQAAENVAASSWAKRINVMQGDIRTCSFAHRFDLIVTNPPFFNNSLLGPSSGKNMARHTTSLSYNDLVLAMQTHLSGEGRAAILLPADEYTHWCEVASAQGWYETSVMHVCHNAESAAKRVIGVFCRNSTAVQKSNLIIKDSAGIYTPEFTQLLAPYYLAL
jgi:tRNA1Val (adenine37-N6)-methyltransferase